LCLEDKYLHLDEFVNKVQEGYKVDLEKDVSLYTLRHFDEKSSYSFYKGKELLRQIIKNTLQIIVKE
jgi:aspartate kinase